ncbi:MAG: type II toxin-antitoxin system RatA family toxin [Pseudomonadota bacterium]
MKTFETAREVGHSADDMFALVADVERYPEFVPLCANLVIRSRTADKDGHQVLTADMTVAYKLLRETFTSQVTLVPDAHRILVRYIDGPFKSLENRWQFEPVDAERCQVQFYLAYAMKSRLFERLAGAVFDRAFGSFADAFERRADKIYNSRERRRRSRAEV